MPAGCTEAAAVEQQALEEEKRKFPWLGLGLLAGGIYLYRRHKKKEGAGAK